MPFIAVRIAIGNSGRVFVSLNGGPGLPNFEGSVAVVDSGFSETSGRLYFYTYP